MINNNKKNWERELLEEEQSIKESLEKEESLSSEEIIEKFKKNIPDCVIKSLNIINFRDYFYEKYRIFDGNFFDIYKETLSSSLKTQLLSLDEIIFIKEVWYYKHESNILQEKFKKVKKNENKLEFEMGQKKLLISLFITSSFITIFLLLYFFYIKIKEKIKKY